MNRYAYVRNNPVGFNDPSGLDAGVFCGTSHDCESGEIGDYKEWVKQYWLQHEQIFQGDSPIVGVSMADYAFAMLQVVLGNGWSQRNTLSAFHVGFWNTATGALNGFPSYLKREKFTGVGDIEDQFWDTRARAPRFIDTLIGYSLGGYVAGSILAHSASHGYAPEAAILIQPAFSVSVFGIYDAGMGTPLEASAAPFTRIITLNGSDSPVGGTIVGSLNVIGSGCGHCVMRATAAFAVWAGRQPLGTHNDRLIIDAARMRGLAVEFRFYPPVPSLLPTPY